MKKRWGVRVIAILMLIAGLLLFLLGILPAILDGSPRDRNGSRGVAGDSQRVRRLRRGALPLVAGSLLLTLVKIADNFAAAAQPAPQIKAAVAGGACRSARGRDRDRDGGRGSC